MLIALLQGCDEQTVAPNTPAPIEITFKDVKGSSTVYVYRIGNCQYLSGQSGVGGNTGVLCHYGECDNPIHKCKCQ